MMMPPPPPLLHDGDCRRYHAVTRRWAAGLPEACPPAAWTTRLPDLRSRLNALEAVEIEVLDDAVLEGVLEAFLRARGIRPSPDLAPYLVRRIDRSVASARDVVERLHEASGQDHRPVTRALAREILDDVTENLDLFDV
jgi:chromosomal replication initiation ATPase DnaA